MSAEVADWVKCAFGGAHEAHVYVSGRVRTFHIRIGDEELKGEVMMAPNFHNGDDEEREGFVEKVNRIGDDPSDAERFVAGYAEGLKSAYGEWGSGIYILTPSVDYSQIKRHAERTHQVTGIKQIIIHEDRHVETVPCSHHTTAWNPDAGDGQGEFQCVDCGGFVTLGEK